MTFFTTAASLVDSKLCERRHAVSKFARPSVRSTLRLDAAKACEHGELEGAVNYGSHFVLAERAFPLAHIWFDAAIGHANSRLSCAGLEGEAAKKNDCPSAVEAAGAVAGS